MARIWIGTYQATLWDTPDGRLGSGYYADSGVVIDRQRAYLIGADAARRPSNHVGDVIATVNPRDIDGKTLTAPVGRRICTDFLDDQAGTIRRIEDTQEKFDRLRTVKGEAIPVDETAPAITRVK